MVNRLLSRVGIHVNYWSRYRQRIFREHATACTIRSRLPRGIYEQYFTFAFVRNPWDWLVSLYHYLLKTPSHRHHLRVLAMRNFREYAEFEIARGKRSQSDFVCDRHGKAIVNFIGRFETLHEDFAMVCWRLRIHAALPHVNRSGHADYCTYYRNDSVVDLVADHFRRDIDLFGYSFGGHAEAIGSYHCDARDDSGEPPRQRRAKHLHAPLAPLNG